MLGMLLLLAACSLVGGVATVGTAWAFAYWTVVDDDDWPERATFHLWSDDSGTHAAMVGHHRGLEIVAGTYEVEYERELTEYVRSFAPHVPIVEFAPTGQLEWAASEGCDHLAVQTPFSVGCGWPVPCLRYELCWDPNRGTVAIGGLAMPERRKSRTQVTGWVLPTTPIWRGMLINWACFTGMALFCCVALRCLVVGARLARGRCPRCGYVIRVVPGGCPECGWRREVAS